MPDALRPLASLLNNFVLAEYAHFSSVPGKEEEIRVVLHYFTSAFFSTLHTCQSVTFKDRKLVFARGPLAVGQHGQPHPNIICIGKAESAHISAVVDMLRSYLSCARCHGAGCCPSYRRRQLLATICRQNDNSDHDHNDSDQFDYRHFGFCVCWYVTISRQTQIYGTVVVLFVR